MTLGMGQHGEISDFHQPQLSQRNQTLGSRLGLQTDGCGHSIPPGRSLGHGSHSRCRGFVPGVVAGASTSGGGYSPQRATAPSGGGVGGESTRAADYRAKRAEYSVLEIPEYWTANSLSAKVTLLTLRERWYDPIEFGGADVVQSPTFPELSQTVEEILAGEL